MFDPSSPATRFRTDTGEDLPRMARLAYETAPVLCDTCRDYHMIWPYLRSHGLGGGGPEHNLPLQIDLLGRAAAGRDSVRWLIAGAADAGVFSLAAKAGASLPNARHAFTVADRCETPLVLCRDHAATNGLDVETVRTDLLAFERDAGFDVVVMHQLLKFFTTADRSVILRRAAGWLAPGGMLCVTVQDEPPAELEAKGRMKAFRAEMLRADAAAGTLDFPDGLEAALTKMLSMNRHRTSDAEALPLAGYVALVEDAGFGIADVVAVTDEHPRTSALREGGPRYMIMARRA